MILKKHNFKHKKEKGAQRPPDTKVIETRVELVEAEKVKVNQAVKNLFIEE